MMWFWLQSSHKHFNQTVHDKQHKVNNRQNLDTEISFLLGKFRNYDFGKPILKSSLQNRQIYSDI
jgi:hypothetical protein